MKILYTVSAGYLPFIAKKKLSFSCSLFTQAEEQLNPAEKALDDVSELIKPMKPQLDKLKDLLQNGSQQAEDAQKNADKAEDEATQANEVRHLLELFQFD